MSLSETRQLLEESRKIVEENGENQSVPLLLNTFINLVSSIDKRLQSVEKGIDKFGEIKNIITSLTSRVITNEKGLQTCQGKITELENNIQGVGNLFDNLKSQCDKNKSLNDKNSSEVDKTKSSINKVSKDISEIKSQGRTSTECNCQDELENLKERVLDLSCRSMKNNLIFTGLYGIRDENTEELLRGFLHTEIGIDYQIEFGNVHRFGRSQRGMRPIVARFLYQADLQYVLENAYRLHNTRYGIKQQFPKEIEDRRKKLYPIMKEAKYNRRNVKLVRDRLYIDNELYEIHDEIDTFDRQVHPEERNDATPGNEHSTPNSQGDRRSTKRPRTSSTPSRCGQQYNVINLCTNDYNTIDITPSNIPVGGNTCTDEIYDQINMIFDVNVEIENANILVDENPNAPSSESLYQSQAKATNIQNINIIYINCCGLKHKLQYPEFETLLQKHEILCFVESKTDDMDEICIPGYKIKAKNRRKISRVKSGGIVLGFRENISDCIQVIETNSKFVLWCKISRLFKDGVVILGVVYIPPEYTAYSSPDAFGEIESEYLELSSKYDNIFMVGDFNARTASEKDYIFIDENDKSNELECVSFNDVCNLNLFNIPIDRNSMDKGKNRYGNQLLELCKCNSLFIMNGRLATDIAGKFTCRNASVVDYCLCNVNFIKNIISLDVLEFSHLYSDVHCPLFICLNHEKKPEFRENLNFEKLDSLLHDLVNVNLESINDDMINSFVDEIGLILIESARETLGTRSDKPKKRAYKIKGDKPWFNLECKFERQNYRKFKRKLKARPSPLLSYKVKESEKRYKKVMDKAIKKHKKDMARKLKNLRSQNTKEYWKILNQREHAKQPNIDFEDLLNFFKELNSGNSDPIDLPTNDTNLMSELNDNLNSPITKEEILKCIKNLKNNKACGDDMIINEYIKTSGDFFIDFYAALFNLIFRTGIVPVSWVIGTIKPFYKNKGNKFDPKNYRPITIVSCMGKLFTAILSNRLAKFSDEVLLLNENQCGFRNGYSTCDCIFTLHSFFEILKLKKKKMFCAFVDFEKAFDTVTRDALWYKMLVNNINGYMYKIIHNMYADIKSCLSYNGEKSDYFPSNIGLRQGENLSPFLFSLFLNDLEDYFCKGNLIGLKTISDALEDELDIYVKLFAILYADDTVLMAESATELNLLLEKFESYCDVWKMKVNVDKTKIMIFCNGRQPADLKFNYGNTELEIVNEFNYLGIYFSKNGSFKANKKHLAEKATRAMYEVIKKGRKHGLSISCQLDLFDKLVKPVLLYGCEIWGFGNNDILERVHLKFCKLLLHLKSSTPNCVIYGELGRYPISLDIKDDHDDPKIKFINLDIGLNMTNSSTPLDFCDLA
ncbi:uncharacterized protein LOC134718363 [Mytilus trossulus]|uniref:uncharacterized protein LOC134718363 n=1 Tax=Mytilus trossulus TaxID=6551 RepID=UPI00300647F1